MLATAALGEKAMSSFRRYLAGALLLTTAVLFSDLAWAFELTGVWATDPTICDKVFTKRGKQIVGAFRPLRQRIHHRGQPAPRKSRALRR